MIRTILVPTDFSDEAGYAVDLAVQIAKKTGSVVKLVNVYEYPVAAAYSSMDVGGPDPIEGEIAREMVDQSRKNMDEVVEALQASGVVVEHEIRIGNPFGNLSKEIDQEEVDLVVMGSRGASGLEEILIGSNAEKVIRSAPCPVITIKRETSMADINHIVFASEFKEGNEDLFEHIKELQQLFEATIHFVRINTLHDFERDHFALKRMKKWVKPFSFGEHTIRIYNDDAEEEGIIHFAEEIDADMLAMGTHGRSGIGRLISGSLAEDIANHAKRPIWTYKMKKS